MRVQKPIASKPRNVSGTVEWHLRQVFAKLGIASRRELSHALDSSDVAVV